MNETRIAERLCRLHPGWTEWDDLVALVRSLTFDYLSDEYTGNYHVSGQRLTFREGDNRVNWPAWMPTYVAALYGMKAAHWEMAGGFAEGFDGNPARIGAVFSPAGNDEMLGFPLLEVPEGVYCFQFNSHGASFFINTELHILYPNAAEKRWDLLDTLEEFTKTNIRQTLLSMDWFSAYRDLKATLLD